MPNKYENLSEISNLNRALCARPYSRTTKMYRQCITTEQRPVQSLFRAAAPPPMHCQPAQHCSIFIPGVIFVINYIDRQYFLFTRGDGGRYKTTLSGGDLCLRAGINICVSHGRLLAAGAHLLQTLPVTRPSASTLRVYSTLNILSESMLLSKNKNISYIKTPKYRVHLKSVTISIKFCRCKIDTGASSYTRVKLRADASG